MTIKVTFGAKRQGVHYDAPPMKKRMQDLIEFGVNYESLSDEEKALALARMPEEERSLLITEMAIDLFPLDENEVEIDLDRDPESAWTLWIRETRKAMARSLVAQAEASLNVEPPALGWLIVGWLIPREVQEEVRGDLHERYQEYWASKGPTLTRLWYWGEVVKLILPFVFRLVLLAVSPDLYKKFTGR